MRTFGNAIQNYYGNQSFNNGTFSASVLSFGSLYAKMDLGVTSGGFTVALQTGNLNYAGTFVANPTANHSSGLLVQAGVVSGDTCATFQNVAGTTTFMQVFGDGGVVIGSSGSLGSGTLNVSTGLYINGVQIYAGIPVNSQSANYTLTASDNGKIIYFTATGKTLTVPTGLPSGFTCSVVNGASTTTTIANNGTQTQALTGNTGSRTLAAYGIASLIQCYGTNSWLINGSGLT